MPPKININSNPPATRYVVLIREFMTEKPKAKGRNNEAANRFGSEYISPADDLLSLEP